MNLEFKSLFNIKVNIVFLQINTFSTRNDNKLIYGTLDMNEMVFLSQLSEMPNKPLEMFDVLQITRTSKR